MSSLDVRNARGQLIIETGCMRGGKTERLITVAKRIEASPYRVRLFTPTTDTRCGPGIVESNGTWSFPATTIDPNNPKKVFEELEKADAQGYVDVVGFDEGNFHNYKLVGVIERLREDRRRIIVIAGLNLDFRGEPFGIMGNLIARADQVHMHQPYCEFASPDGRQCGQVATNTVRALSQRVSSKRIELEPVQFYRYGQEEPTEGYFFAPYWDKTIRPEQKDGKDKDEEYAVFCAQHFRSPRKRQTNLVHKRIQEARGGISRQRLEDSFGDIPDLEEIIEFLVTEKKVRQAGTRYKAMEYKQDPISKIFIPKY